MEIGGSRTAYRGFLDFWEAFCGLGNENTGNIYNGFGLILMLDENRVGVTAAYSFFSRPRDIFQRTLWPTCHQVFQYEDVHSFRTALSLWLGSGLFSRSPK